MKTKKTLILAFFSLVMFNSVFGQNFKEVKNANDVLENAITALGGKEYLLSIKTLYSDISTEMEGRQAGALDYKRNASQQRRLSNRL